VRGLVITLIYTPKQCFLDINDFEGNVFVLAVTLYFLLACLISWMVLFPSGREFVLAALAGAGARLQTLGRAAARQRAVSMPCAALAMPPPITCATFLCSTICCAGSLALLCLPPWLPSCWQANQR
jgi:peptidoglycan L-alanyl-D-glutamate endopeptidase CwlK